MRSQDTFAAVVAKPRYSASVEEQAIVVCFLEDQETQKDLLWNDDQKDH